MAEPSSDARDTVLVLTNPCDVVADRVVQMMRDQNCQVVRFDPAELPLRSTITMGVGPDAMQPFIFRNWGPGILLDQVKSVWYRRPGDFVLPSYPSGHITQFAITELTMALGGILRALDCFWMNSPSAIVEADYKVEQLVRAYDIGLRVPDSIITSQSADARRFVAEHKPHVIIKTLGDPNIYAPDEGPGLVTNIFTSRLAEADLEKFDRVNEAPVLLQEEIVKEADIRITLVGNTVFAVAIESQGHSTAVTDWRKGGPGLAHNVITIPDELEQKLLRFMQSYGLSFAAVDMVLDKSGNYVFLELNPIGEWGWLERMTDLDISTSIATLLMNGGISPSGESNSHREPDGIKLPR